MEINRVLKKASPFMGQIGADKNQIILFIVKDFITDKKNALAFVNESYFTFGVVMPGIMKVRIRIFPGFKGFGDRFNMTHQNRVHKLQS
jgi:hypothetical protein